MKKKAKRNFPEKKRRRLSPALIAGLVLLLPLIFLAVLAPVLSPYDPMAQDLYAVLKAPGPGHIFGSDQLGRDVFSRMLYAARTDLTIMVLAEAVPFVTGVFLGMAAGYFGGWVDALVVLATDTFIAFPFYLLVIVIAFATGAGAHGIYITFILVGWIVYARVIRGQTASLKKQGWVDSARILGFSHLRILLAQILPNVLAQAVVLLMSDMVGMLVMIVTLGYLGIGIAPPTPDWGTMISEGQSLISSAWWLSVFPGLAVVYTGIALSLIGDGLADLWRQDGF